MCSEIYTLHVLRCMGKVLMPHLTSFLSSSCVEQLEDELRRILAAAWSAFDDCRKKSIDLVQSMLELFFPPELCHGSLPTATLHSEDGLLRQYFDKFVALGEQMRPGLMQLLVLHLCGIWRRWPEGAEPYLGDLVEFCLYKEPLFKQMGAGGLEAVGEDNDGGDNTPIGARRFVRVTVNVFLDSLPVPAPTATQLFLDRFIITLLDLSMEPDLAGALMVDSKPFGRKLRSWQTLCLLAKHVSEDLLPEVNKRLWVVMQQPNLNQIAHYVELFATHISLSFPELVVRQHVVKQLSDVSTSGKVAASYSLVLGVLLPQLARDETATGPGSLREACVLCMLPWLSCATGHTRTIACCIVSEHLPQLVSAAQKQDDAQGCHLSAGFSDAPFMRSTLKMMEQSKEISRMVRKQASYFHGVDTVRECSLEALLSTPLNRLNEYQPVTLMQRIQDTMNNLHRQVCAEDAAKRAVGLKESGDDSVAASNGNVGSNAGDVQRKIAVWEDAQEVVLQNAAGDPSSLSQRAKMLGNGRQRQSVLVCASLVDKVPNLAGLARTCEIFGLEGLTIPSKKLMNQPLFTQISVTAEKWVPVHEVTEEGMRPYLISCKRAGYTIVGLEQTANSHNLLDYEFPEKVVFVLGKEREGIPVDVLQEVDQCVEIPQLGLLRSLNVHVSGAILIWHYTQQHMLRKRQLMLQQNE